VTGTVVIVITLLPQELTCEDVELGAGRAFRKARLVQGNMALEYQGEHTPDLCAGVADRHRSGNVRRTVKVLSTAVHQVDIIHLQRCRGAVKVIVVAHGGITRRR
jgi:hypothetical protein